MNLSTHPVLCSNDQIWVADFTCVYTAMGTAYTAFVIDVFARKIVG